MSDEDEDLGFSGTDNTMDEVSIDSWEDVSKAKARAELEDQVAAFLAKGGQINYVDSDVLADPPKKPTSNYGSQPI